MVLCCPHSGSKLHCKFNISFNSSTTPTGTDVNFLLNNGHNVGSQTGSFVYKILREMGFRDENLKTYNSAEELNQLFRNGSRNNGISAAFDEQPYMKVLATYCSKYISMDPTFKTDGFAFVS